MNTSDTSLILARNIVQRARDLALMQPSELARSGLIDLVELDYQLEKLTTTLARQGFVPLNGHFRPDEPDDAYIDPGAARGKFYDANHGKKETEITSG